MTEAPLAWVKEIHNTLIEAKAIPLSGFAPAFPWEEFSEKIAEMLQQPELKIVPRHTKFLKGSEITSGLGAGFIPLSLELTPLSGQAFWIMGKEDVAKLAALALTPSNGNKGFSSPKFQEGFYYYLATLALQALDERRAFNDLSVKLGKSGTLPQDEALCVDVEIQHPKHTFWGRLVCPASLHEAFKTHFSTEQPAPLTSALAKQMDVTVRLELGQTILSLSEWKGANVGDFILLDRCTFDPKTHKGTATLMLEHTPILRVRIKDNSLKIVDYAIYREEQNQMNSDTPQDENNSETDEFSSAEFEAEGNAEENHLWSAQNGGLEKMVSTKEIPLTLSVEVARLRINLEKLLQLSPGNVLELPVKPEQGVDIVVGGKKVAKAELIKLGEMLGVKILQIGE
ncbi:MAG: type III secretion system cytoplasmic ring protein SctQ [Verrucomicrobia bacterium]|nr:type III secretion system cytoplasmic ring protein SctQ [Verrucomicrobiota bacterium]